MRVVRVGAGETRTIEEPSYLPSNLMNRGPGVALIEGVVIPAGGYWASPVVGQRSFVISTLDEPAEIGVG